MLAKGCDGQVVVENGFYLPLTCPSVGIHISFKKNQHQTELPVQLLHKYIYIIYKISYLKEVDFEKL